MTLRRKTSNTHRTHRRAQCPLCVRPRALPSTCDDECRQIGIHLAAARRPLRVAIGMNDDDELLARRRRRTPAPARALGIDDIRHI